MFKSGGTLLDWTVAGRGNLEEFTDVFFDVQVKWCTPPILAGPFKVAIVLNKTLAQGGNCKTNWHKEVDGLTSKEASFYFSIIIYAVNIKGKTYKVLTPIFFLDKLQQVLAAPLTELPLLAAMPAYHTIYLDLINARLKGEL